MSSISDCILRKQFRRIDEVYKIDRNEVEKVKTDFEMMIDGWNISFAVDFHQIYNYLHPKKRKDEDKETEHEIFLRAAGTFIFSELEEIEKLFILPPHSTELINHLVHLKEEVMIIREYVSEDLLEEHERQNLENAKEIYDTGGELSKELMDEILELINAKFLRLYKLVSGGFRNEIAEVNNLFKSRKISKVTEVWDEDVIDVIQKESQKSVKEFKWFDGFRELRPKNRNIANNVRDARVIQIIMAVNDFFKEKNKKEVIYLISDAETMERVLNWDMFDDLNWKEEEHPLGTIKNLGKYKSVRILRNSKSFLVYLFNKSKSENKQKRRINTIRNLTARRRELDKLAAIRAMIMEEFVLCTTKCNDPEKEKQCLKIRNKIEEFEREYRKTSSFKLISESRQLLKPYIDGFGMIHYRDTENLRDVKSLVDFLLLEKKDFEKRIKRETEELEVKINQTLSSLRSDIIKGLSFESFWKMNYKLRRLRGIPYKIMFKNEVIRDSLKEFFELMDEYAEELQKEKKEDKFRDIQERWRKILELTENESLGLEHRLLLALIFFSYKLYHDVISIRSEIESELADNPEIKKEFLLLECLANYRLCRIKEIDRYFEIARDICDECVGKHHDDPRFLNLSAILRAIIAPTEENIGSSLYFLDRAKKISEKEDSEWNDKNTKSTILNNVVFISLMRKDIDLNAILKIEGLMKEMEDLYPRDDWDSEVLHTEGVLFLKKSRITESSEERKKLLKMSINDFRRALEMAEELDLDKHRIKNIKIDLERAEKDQKEI
jgi:hypothetical protein